MSRSLWQLPEGLLKMTYAGWDRLDYGIKLLVVELAKQQNFKCALCSQNRSLLIDHDHEPQQGTGQRLTIYNIRGLVCHRCNWHLGIYETDKRGEYCGWNNIECVISDDEYHHYDYVYRCRVIPLFHQMMEEKLGPVNYWRWRTALQKLDDWKDGLLPNPWYHGFAEIKKRKRGRIFSPEQFVETLSACIQFIMEEVRKNPEYEPPDDFVLLMGQIRPLFNGVRPIAVALMHS